MVDSSTAIAKEGWPVIGLTALASLVFSLLGYAFFALLSLFLCAFSLYFFRDPERVAPKEDNLATSPADGRILHIRTLKDPLTGEDCTCISIFMSVFNVHVNRVPIASEVTDIRYWPGKFFNASFDKASRDNERCALRLKGKQGEQWTMVQIAGLIARRIVCRVQIGDHLEKAERFGMIRFGSRVDLYLPAIYEPAVTVGEHVIAGQSVIAKACQATGA